MSVDNRPTIIYYQGVIRSFACRQTETLFRHQRPKRFGAEILRVALRKLVMLDSAASLEDMRVPPGNRLEALKGDRKGRHSIRVNDQWRVCFIWRDENAYEVEIVDYH